MKFTGLIAAVMLFTFGAFAQEITIPRPSPFQEITQYVGISEVTIAYSRPAVKEREIWGGLVPYDRMWRTGANENTTVTLSHNAKINGESIEAGKYGLLTIPGETEWTLIFSRDNSKWGTMGYNEANDALRLTVTPEEAAFAERMTFSFNNLTDSTATVSLHWETLAVSFEVEFATQAIVMNSISEKLDWALPASGAQYVIANDAIAPDAGLRLINASIAINKNYWNLRLKAQLLALNEQYDDAVAVMEEAFDLASEMQREPYDIAEMKLLVDDWKSK